MRIFGVRCPSCGEVTSDLKDHCEHCGALTTESVSRISGPVRRYVAMEILIAISIILLGVGFFSSSMSAVTQTALCAAAAVCGILARIAQAGAQHIKLMDKLDGSG